MAKTRRRYCDNPKCGLQYRYTRDDSKTCSDACRTMLSPVSGCSALNRPSPTPSRNERNPHVTG